jgi:arsenite-transporting ATPase
MIRWGICFPFWRSIEVIAMPVIKQFFIGKGGVGKSTTAALTALSLAREGRDTLLVSMDPAHNQRDIFQLQFSEKPMQVTPNLAVREVDQEYWMATYLKETQKQLKKAYSYQSAFNIQNHYGILKYSPGLEEYALLRAFENIVQTEVQRDVIVFDMPPTALTMRFFSLPAITRVWLDALMKLRRQIYAKKEIVSKIQFGSREIEQDKVASRLTDLIDVHRRLREDLIAQSTRINLVLNPDRLSLAEAKRIRGKLEEIEMGIDHILINKVTGQSRLGDITAEFAGYSIHRIPLSSADLSGLGALNKHIDNASFFSDPTSKGEEKHVAAN